jgi:AraC family transcriptional regulator
MSQQTSFIANAGFAPDERRADAHPGFLTQSASTYAGVLTAAGGQQLEALTRRDDNSAVCAALYVSPPYKLEVPALSVWRLSVNLTRARVTGGLAGERARRFEAKRHSLFLTPADAAVRWHKESPSRHLNIYFHREGFDCGEDRGLWGMPDAPLFNIAVPSVRGLADELVAELASTGLMATEASDSLARLLLVHVARHQQQASRLTDPLTSQTLARLHDYVMAHLSERIAVVDLARQAGMSANRFAHFYSERTGQAPHQFVLTMRLQQAAQLLRHSRMSLTDVAHACGFASQQHLTNTMKKRLGCTPGRYRSATKTPASDPNAGLRGPGSGVLSL